MVTTRQEMANEWGRTGKTWGQSANSVRPHCPTCRGGLHGCGTVHDIDSTVLITIDPLRWPHRQHAGDVCELTIKRAPLGLASRYIHEHLSTSASR